VSERLTLKRILRRAIENEELMLYYQPRVEAGSRALVGHEALVRWRHPELGMVSPGQFIPLAEETGLIVPIGEWVLETACKQNKAWQDAGLAPVRMAVNISPLQFRQRSLAERVKATLERTGLAPEYLELEVTESGLMHDGEVRGGA
jgi:EAL domain-containing protein (putative c-di-GMP-specific phosphodiesterase class I)